MVNGQAGFRLVGAGLDYGPRTVLHDLDAVFLPGRVYGLVGHNGSGKSSLLSLLAGHRQPSRGEVLFEDKPVAAWGVRDFARRVAFLPQTLAETDGLSVRELAGFGRYPWRGLFGRPGEADHAAVEEALAEAGVAGWADRPVDTLSGGERQRAWLAMLLAQQPSCLLLDEPIAALDLARQVEMLSLTRRLCADKGIGSIIVLHEINMAARFCDRLVAMKQGRIIAEGTPAELMNERSLEAIYDLKMVTLRHPVSGAVVGLPQ